MSEPSFSDGDSYENFRRIVYNGGATFIPVCEICHRFVKPNKIIRVWNGLKNEPNAICSKCGDTKMIFEGFF